MKEIKNKFIQWKQEIILLKEKIVLWKQERDEVRKEIKIKNENKRRDGIAMKFYLKEYRKMIKNKPDMSDKPIQKVCTLDMMGFLEKEYLSYHNVDMET